MSLSVSVSHPAHNFGAWMSSLGALRVTRSVVPDDLVIPNLKSGLIHVSNPQARCIRSVMRLAHGQHDDVEIRFKWVGELHVRPRSGVPIVRQFVNQASTLLNYFTTL
jgi:hypothetical protein